MRFAVRDLVYIGIFGALWGTVETTLGAVLHVMNIPLTGMVLAAVGIAIALIGRLFVPRVGAVLFIGLVTALVKMLSLGGIILTPMIGIIVESLLAEGVLMVLGVSRGSFVVAGGVAVCWAFAHPFVVQGVLFGRGILVIYGQILESGSRLLGIDPSAALLVITVLVVLYFVTGCTAGIVAWNAGRLVRERIRPVDGAPEFR